MDMEKVSYEDVKNTFNEVWQFSREQLWYKKAWTILEKCNLTSYDNREEECVVFLRAITLEMIYKEFCDVTFGEYCEHGAYYDNLCGNITDFEIGQVYGRNNNQEFAESEYYAVNWLADNEWELICKTLADKMDINELFLGMFLTAFTPNCLFEDDSLAGKYDIETYEGYWEFIKKEGGEIVSTLPSEYFTGYDWTINQPRRIRDL